MYILKVYSIHYTLRQNTNLKKFPSDKMNREKYPLFPFVSPNSSQLRFAILISAEAQGSSL